MPAQITQVIPSLGTPPTTADPATFDSRADTLLGTALPAMVTAENVFATQANALSTEVSAKAAEAEVDAATASAAATAADATANATLWVSAGSYTAGQNRYSPINYLTYRAITTHSGETTDPSLDATNWVSLTPVAAPPGMTLIATLTPTVAGTLNFLTAFSSTYDNYLIIGTGLSVTADAYFSLRLATAGSADTGSNYANLIGADAAGNFSTLGAAATSAQPLGTAISAGIGINFEVTIRNVNDAVKIKSMVSHATYQSAAAPTYRTGRVQTAYIAANTVSGFTLFTNTSTFDATGTIRVYGYANS